MPTLQPDLRQSNKLQSAEKNAAMRPRDPLSTEALLVGPSRWVVFVQRTYYLGLILLRYSFPSPRNRNSQSAKVQPAPLPRRANLAPTISTSYCKDQLLFRPGKVAKLTNRAEPKQPSNSLTLMNLIGPTGSYNFHPRRHSFCNRIVKLRLQRLISRRKTTLQEIEIGSEFLKLFPGYSSIRTRSLLSKISHLRSEPP